jgi:hypothetical protein
VEEAKYVLLLTSMWKHWSDGSIYIWVEEENICQILNLKSFFIDYFLSFICNYMMKMMMIISTMIHWSTEISSTIDHLVTKLILPSVSFGTWCCICVHCFTGFLKYLPLLGLSTWYLVCSVVVRLTFIFFVVREMPSLMHIKHPCHCIIKSDSFSCTVHNLYLRKCPVLGLSLLVHFLTLCTNLIYSTCDLFICLSTYEHFWLICQKWWIMYTLYNTILNSFLLFFPNSRWYTNTLVKFCNSVNNFCIFSLTFLFHENELPKWEQLLTLFKDFNPRICMSPCSFLITTLSTELSSRLVISKIYAMYWLFSLPFFLILL